MEVLLILIALHTLLLQSKGISVVIMFVCVCDDNDAEIWLNLCVKFFACIWDYIYIYIYY